MIELRWQERTMLDPESVALQPGMRISNPVLKVLQFRAWETVIGDGFGHSGYGDWQDVPTVRHPSLDAAPGQGEKK